MGSNPTPDTFIFSLLQESQRNLHHANHSQQNDATCERFCFGYNRNPIPGRPFSKLFSVDIFHTKSYYPIRAFPSIVLKHILTRYSIGAIWYNNRSISAANNRPQHEAPGNKPRKHCMSIPRASHSGLLFAADNWPIHHLNYFTT